MAICLRSAEPLICASSNQASEQIDLTRIPSCYQDLKSVFSKSKADSLPPHRPYDRAIELLPGAPFPKSRLFNLSVPEKLAMVKYIQEELSAGLIRPSSSPVGMGFFSLKRKIRLCVPA